MKRVLSFLLATIIAFSACVCAYAQEEQGCDCGYDPTVFVDGLGMATIYKNVNTGEEMFSTDVNTYLSLLRPGDISKLLFSIIFKRWNLFGDTLTPIAQAVLSGTGCNGQGEFPEGQGIIWDYPEITEHGRDSLFRFSYDWRVSPLEVADDLKAYIDYVCEQTGHDKVKLIGFSMGTAVMLSYLKEYGNDRVSGVVLYAGAYNGTSCCGEPFCLLMDYDGESVLRYLRDLMGNGDAGEIVNPLLALLYKNGVLDFLGDFFIGMCENLGDRVFEEIILDSFIISPAMWSLVPPQLYAQARRTFFGGREAEYSGLLAKIDEYHNEVQLHAGDIIDCLIEDGINFGIVSKYGLQGFPLTKSAHNTSDTVIDTVYSSFGATCAQVDGTLGEAERAAACECGRSHVSADLMINAATCRYPEYTWFVRGLPHSSTNRAAYDLMEYILYSDGQVTVWDNADYPQFLVYDSQTDSTAPLTAANCPQVEALYCEKSSIELSWLLTKAIAASIAKK